MAWNLVNSRCLRSLRASVRCQFSLFNHREVVKTLNKGAFAEVYQAIEISSGRAVALKVQKLDNMFANEIKLMKTITRHQIVGFPQLSAFGKLDDDYGFIAMDLLGQNSLEVLRKLEQRKTPIHSPGSVGVPHHGERSYGFPLASIVAIGLKLVIHIIFIPQLID